jgi:hypothetical protein
MKPNPVTDDQISLELLIKGEAISAIMAKDGLLNQIELLAQVVARMAHDHGVSWDLSNELADDIGTIIHSYIMDGSRGVMVENLPEVTEN